MRKFLHISLLLALCLAVQQAPANIIIHPPPIVGAVITTYTFQNNSGVTLPAGTPVQLGQAFRYGDVLPTNHPVVRDAITHQTLQHQQFDEIDTWRENGGNGSWRHAVWVADLPNSLANGAAYQVEFVLVRGAYTKAPVLALSALCSGVNTHNLQIHLTDVRNQDDTTRGSGEAFFNLCANITNVGRDAPRIIDQGPVRSTFKVVGRFLYTNSTYDPMLYAECNVQLYVNPTTGNSLADTGWSCWIHNSWMTVAAGTSGHAGNPGPVGLTNDPQAISYRPEMLDGATASVLNWSGLDQTVASASSPILTTGCGNDNFGNLIAACLNIPGSTGTNALYFGEAVRITSTGATPVGGLTNNTLRWVYPDGSANNNCGSSNIVSIENRPSPLDTATQQVLTSSQGTNTTTFAFRVWHTTRMAWAMLDQSANDNWSPGGTTQRVTREVDPAFTPTEQSYWEETGIVTPLQIAGNTSTVGLNCAAGQSANYYPMGRGNVIGGTGAGFRPDLSFPNTYAVQAFVTRGQANWHLARLFSLSYPNYPYSDLLDEATGRIPTLNNGPPTGPGGNGVGGTYAGLSPTNRVTYQQSPPTDFAPPLENVPLTGTNWEAGIWPNVAYGALDHQPSFQGFSYAILGSRHWLDMLYSQGNRGYSNQLTGPGEGKRNDAAGTANTYWGLFLNCCQGSGSARGIWDRTLAASLGGNGNVERSYYNDIITENGNYYPRWLTWKNGAGNSNWTTSIIPPDFIGGGFQVDTLTTNYLLATTYALSTYLHAPLGAEWAPTIQRFYEGCLGELLTGHQVSYYCIENGYAPALANGGFDKSQANVGQYINGVDGSDHGGFTEYTDVRPGAVLHQQSGAPPAGLSMASGGTVKLFNGLCYGAFPIDQLSQTTWYPIINPNDSAGTFQIQCSAADHTNFPSQCPTPGGPFTAFTRGGAAVNDVTDCVLYRPSYDPGPGFGFQDNVHAGYGDMILRGLDILGYDVSQALTTFNNRWGYPTKPINYVDSSQWFDPTVGVPGLPAVVTYGNQYPNVACGATSGTVVSSLGLIQGNNGSPGIWTMLPTSSDTTHYGIIGNNLVTVGTVPCNTTAAIQVQTTQVGGATVTGQLNITVPTGALTLILTPMTTNPSCTVAGGTLISTASSSGGNGNPITYSMTGNLVDFMIDSVSGAITVAPAGIRQSSCGQTYNNVVTNSQSGGGGSPATALLTDATGNLLTDSVGNLLTSGAVNCTAGQTCRTWANFSTVQMLTPSGDTTGAKDLANIVAAQANCPGQTIELAAGVYYVASPGVPANSGCIVEGHYSNPTTGTALGGTVIRAAGTWSVGSVWTTASHETFRNLTLVGIGQNGPNCLAGVSVTGVTLDMVNVVSCSRGVSITGTGNEALRWYGGSAINNSSYGGFFQNVDDLPVWGVTFRGNASDGTCNLDFDTGTSNIRYLGGYNENVVGSGCGVQYAGSMPSLPGAMVQGVQFHNIGGPSIWDNGGILLTMNAVQAGNDNAAGPLVQLTNAGSLNFGGNVWSNGCVYRANASPSGQFAIYEQTVTNLYCDATTTTALQGRVVAPNTTFPVDSSNTSVTILPTPPTGFHWVQSFGDEFSTTFPNQGTSSSQVTLDTTAWQIDHWCGSANYAGSYTSPNYGCAATNTASATVAGGLLTLGIQAPAPATRTIIDTHMVAGDQGHNYQPLTNPTAGGFVQRYGYFVYDSKLPTCGSSQFDLEAFARDTWTVGGVYGELGWVSGTNPGCNYSALRPYEGDQNHTFHFINATDPGIDITQAFHQYGLLWTNDATAHGSVVVYFDGTPMTSPYALVSPAWDNGLFFDVYWDPCTGCEGGTGISTQGSTMQFDWVRAYQLAPNTVTATLTASPTSVSSGGSSTLTWSSTNALTCVGTGFSTGGALSGSVSTGPLTTNPNNYSINCSGATANASVTVGAPLASASYNLSNGGNSIAVGGSFGNTPNMFGSNTSTSQQWTWDSVAETWVSVYYLGTFPAYLADNNSGLPQIDNVVDTWSVIANGSGWNIKDLRTNNYLTIETGTGTLKMIPSGTQTPTVWTASLVTTPPPPSATLSASPTSVSSGGSSILTWSSTNASSCAGTGFSTGTGSATSGSVSTGPLTTNPNNYSINCNGAVANASVTVTGGGGLSPDGTISNAPSGASLTGIDGVWSWGASAGGGEYNTLLNGSSSTGGTGVEMEVFNGGHMYVLGANGLWYTYNASNNTWPQTSAPGGGGGGGCVQATTFIARTSGENTSALTTMICGLVTDGIITGDLTSGGTKCGALLDRLYIMAMVNSTDALLDVCGNASAVVNGSPTFTANAGYTGIDASTTDYLNTGFVPSSAGGNYTQNSAHLSVWALNNVTSSSGGGVAIGADTTGTSNLSQIYAKWSAGNAYATMNDNGATSSGVANSNTIGFYTANRTGASTMDLYKNTSVILSHNTTTTGLATRSILLLALNDTTVLYGSSLQLAEASIGAKLTSGQITSMKNRICTYLTVVHGSC